MNTTATTDLDAFVGLAKSNGLDDDALVPLLRRNGWPERRVYDALTRHYASTFGSDVPTWGGTPEYARDGFHYFVNFITLGAWATALGQIFYVLIAHRFPDATAYGYPYGSGQSLVHEIAWQLATLIVTFPIFLVIHRAIERRLARRPDTADSGVRLWLTYVALVITAMICMCDGVWFLQALLLGELSIRFVLDTVVLAGIGGGIFTYYLTGLRRSPDAVAA